MRARPGASPVLIPPTPVPPPCPLGVRPLPLPRPGTGSVPGVFSRPSTAFLHLLPRRRDPGPSAIWFPPASGYVILGPAPRGSFRLGQRRDPEPRLRGPSFATTASPDSVLRLVPHGPGPGNSGDGDEILGPGLLNPSRHTEARSRAPRLVDPSHRRRRRDPEPCGCWIPLVANGGRDPGSLAGWIPLVRTGARSWAPRLLDPCGHTRRRDPWPLAW